MDNNNTLSIGSTFGSISGIITSLGAIIGMYGANLPSKPIIISLVSIAMSDSISDALGIYYGVNVEEDNQESFNQASRAFIAKFFFPLLMVIPFLLLEKSNAVMVNLLCSLTVVLVVSSSVFKKQTEIITNMLIVLIAIILIYNVGKKLQ